MKHLNKLPDALANAFKIKWDAFIDASKSTNVIIPSNPEFLDALKHVFVFSNFAAECCSRDPKMLTNLFESGDLQSGYSEDTYLNKLDTVLAGIKDETQLEHLFRRFRHCEMVRIAWRDLIGWADLSETMRDLSAFADACIDCALDILYEWQCVADGIPIGTDGLRQRLVVIGMGKLGGRELNFSSDVDLIFAYPEVGETKGSGKAISNEAFFLRLCRRLIKVLGKTTADGFVFRVDTRLRPHGENGPLVMSFDALEQYYQRQGREWERYAWIKARVVAGDKVAGSHLLERLKPFVYRRYLDFGAFESLRDMKEKISLEVRRKQLQNNIKLGPGGIREIEFFGQMFQLIRGGVIPSLQEPGIKKVLATLAGEGIIPQKVGDELCRAYVFLRTLENRLQEFSDQQTHLLPSGEVENARLALSMNFKDSQTFADHLKLHREKVHDHFTMLLNAKDSADEDKESKKALQGVWHELLEEKEAEKQLSAVGFSDPRAVLGLLDHLRDDLMARMPSSEGRQRLDKLIPLLLKVVGISENSLATLIRIIDLVKAIKGRASYLALLLENPHSLTHLVKLCDASPFIASFLTRHPVLLDELLDPRSLYVPPGRDELEKELVQRMDRLHDNFEYQMEELRIFKQENVFRVAAADVTEALALMRVSDHLSDLAEIVLNKVIELAWDHLTEKHGIPTCRLDGQPSEQGFAVVAYGKFGGLELGYSSDLDMVFLHSGTQGHTRSDKYPIDNRQFFARLGQRVIHILTAHTRAGTLYETDMRLRPSGSAGILVSHIESFHDYQVNKAWTWEHQALIRARAVGGDPLLMQRFEEIRKAVIGRPRKKTRLQKDVAEMRERMRKELLIAEPGMFDLKQGSGGIVDIEFLVQYLVLLKSHKSRELLKWTDNVRLIQTLLETGVFDEYTANLLKHAYLIYRATAHKLSLQEKQAKVPEEKLHRLRDRVEKIWQVFLGNS